jgi:hypothetical protein
MKVTHSCLYIKREPYCYDFQLTHTHMMRTDTQTEFTGHKEQTHTHVCGSAPRGWVLDRCGNDPSAGSPTDTLLRLHLPLNGKV